MSTNNKVVREIPSDSRWIELSIIIVDFNSQKFTLALVNDLKKKLAGIKHEIIIVDNFPNSDADQIFSKEFAKSKNIKIIKSKENNGYGSGNNLGAKEAQGKYLWLLNPDTEIFDDTAEKMLDFLSKHFEVGALTPIILQPDRTTPQRHFFGHFQTLSRIILRNQAGVLSKNLSFLRKRESTNSGSPTESGMTFFYTDMITGAGLMIRRELFEKLNGFDPNIFMYLEDEDLCRRIAKQGLKNAVLTTAKIIHFEGQSSNSFEKKRFYYQSQDYYWQKHCGTVKTILMKVLRFPYIIFQQIKNLG